MSARTQRKYTKNGFPKPYAKDEYHQDDIVWVLISKDLPFWPAQIKTGGTIFSAKKQTTTKGLSNIPVMTFNDPAFSVVIHTKDAIINETIKQKKRKKVSTKRRSINRNKILKWEEKKNNDAHTEINYDDILLEFVKRKKLPNIEAIDESIFKQWNDIALNDAEQELKRLADLKRLEAQRRLEHEQLQRAHEEEMHKQQSMKDQIYDGRKYNLETGEYEGWELRAGDRIRYWPSNNIANSNNLITTTIIKLRDKYGTLRLKDTVAIDVECDANPPFWNTEIEKLPERDPKFPIYYPLHQSLFHPSQIENQMEKKHQKRINDFKTGLKNTGWGNMLYSEPNGAETCTNNKQMYTKSKNDAHSNKKKKNRKRKRMIMDEENATDSDIVILNNNKESDNTENNGNIINKSDSMQFSFEKKKMKRKRRISPLSPLNKIPKKTAKQPRKKRKLNKPNKMMITGSDIEEVHDKMSQDTSEDEALEPYLQGIKAVHSEDNVQKDSDCEIIKVKAANAINITSDIEESASVIPWPEAQTKIKKKKKIEQDKNHMMDCDPPKKSKRKTRYKATENTPPKQKKKTSQKRKTPNFKQKGKPPKKRKIPNFKQKKETPKKTRAVMLTNYVDDGCCPQMMKSNEYHDDLCVNKGCQNTEHLFMSGNGSFAKNNNNNDSVCLSQHSTTSASTFAGDYYSESSSSVRCMDDNNNAQRKIKKKKKLNNNNKGKMSDIASLRNKDPSDTKQELVHKLDTLIIRQRHTKVQSHDITSAAAKKGNNNNKKQTRKRKKNVKPEIKSNQDDVLSSDITNQLNALYAFGKTLKK